MTSEMLTPDERVAAGVALLGLADAGEVLTLQLAAWVREAHANDTLAIPPLHEGLAEVRGQLGDPVWTIWGLREHGRLLAIVRIRPDGPDAVFLARLGVVPDLHRQGLGGAMLRHAEASLSDTVRRVELVTGIHSVDNQAFYARHGYQIVGRDPEIGIVTMVKTR